MGQIVRWCLRKWQLVGYITQDLRYNPDFGYYTYPETVSARLCETQFDHEQTICYLPFA